MGRLLNQAQVAVGTGYSVSLIQKIEGDKPGPATLAKATVAKFLGVTFDVEESLAEEDRLGDYPREIRRLSKLLSTLAHIMAEISTKKQPIPQEIEDKFLTVQKLLNHEKFKRELHPQDQIAIERGEASDARLSRKAANQLKYGGKVITGDQLDQQQLGAASTDPETARLEREKKKRKGK